MSPLRAALLVFLTLLAAPAHSAVLVGRGEAVDGDTLILRGEKIRLFGIDAPEHDQTCDRDGKNWDCGKWSGQQLAQLLRGRSVTCEGDAHDRFGRLLAVCRVEGQILNAALVRDGAAYAYRRYSNAFVPEENIARSEKRGLWAARMVTPEAYRHPEGAGSAPTAGAGGCQLKGNISARGERIFHSPGQEHYATTVISPSKGERWFCTAAEARAAGWRPAAR
ncbi:thermonuclease family protein [Tabrizicola sp. J26]|uniref:thermonuclease family protein n=1 Tax=Alitabrizicola rongguiensis TaxID=2909234 RepID=UPI001F271358|nr:thermonuclease family protein [Tabrizicola rongguiensis]MCF1708883.1 thermonuclease family protein [Tabrizicola rongguiensis]